MGAWKDGLGFIERGTELSDWLIVGSIYGRMAWSLARNAVRPRDQRRVGA